VVLFLVVVLSILLSVIYRYLQASFFQLLCFINNNNSFICMTISYYSIAKAYNLRKRTYNVIMIKGDKN